jgi:hypothetical protein
VSGGTFAWTLTESMGTPYTYYHEKELSGTWSGGRISGTQVGFGASVGASTGTTWISVANVTGTFDANALAFQTYAAGLSIETPRYLSMAAETHPGDRDKLTRLNMPAYEVGSQTLSGSGNNFSNLSMENVKFFAPTAGGRPTVWASGSVTGSYSAPPATGTPISLSGTTLNAAFTFQNWNPATSGTWLGTVNGTGGFNGSTTFRGAAAGTGAGPGAGTISGTAAGVAR